MHPIFWLGIAMLISSGLTVITRCIKDNKVYEKEKEKIALFNEIEGTIWDILTIIILAIGLFLS